MKQFQNYKYSNMNYVIAMNDTTLQKFAASSEDGGSGWETKV